MSILRALRDLIVAVLRLFRDHPLDMLAVALTRMFAGKAAAQKRLTAILDRDRAALERRALIANDQLYAQLRDSESRGLD